MQMMESDLTNKATTNASSANQEISTQHVVIKNAISSSSTTTSNNNNTLQGVSSSANNSSSALGSSSTTIPPSQSSSSLCTYNKQANPATQQVQSQLLSGGGTTTPNISSSSVDNTNFNKHQHQQVQQVVSKSSNQQQQQAASSIIGQGGVQSSSTSSQQAASTPQAASASQSSQNSGQNEPKKSRQKQGRKGAGKRRSETTTTANTPAGSSGGVSGGVGGPTSTSANNEGNSNNNEVVGGQAANNASTGIPLHVATNNATNSLIGSSSRSTQNDHLASVTSPGTTSAATFGNLSRKVALGQIVSAEQTQKGQLSADELVHVCKELEERARQCEASIVQEILEFHGGGKQIPKRNLNAALRECVKGCKTSLLDDCIQTVAHLIDANATVNSEDQGRTALMMACEAGYIELVRCLLDHHALVNIQDPLKRTALHYAIEAKAQNIDVVQELIKRDVPINEPASDGLTPLLLAAQKGHFQIVNILLQAGANLTFQAGDNQDSALHLTCASGDFNTVHALLDFAKRRLDRGTQQKFLYLENKLGLKALQLVDLRLSKNPESQPLKRIHELLGGMDRAINAETEEEIQTLLKKEEQQSVIKQQNNSNKVLSRMNSSSQQQQSQNQQSKGSATNARNRQAIPQNQIDQHSSSPQDASTASISSNTGGLLVGGGGTSGVANSASVSSSSLNLTAKSAPNGEESKNGAFGAEKVKIDVKFEQNSLLNSKLTSISTTSITAPLSKQSVGGVQQQTSGLLLQQETSNSSTSTIADIANLQASGDTKSKKKSGQQQQSQNSNNPHNKFGASRSSSNLLLPDEQHQHQQQHHANNHFTSDHQQHPSSSHNSSGTANQASVSSGGKQAAVLGSTPAKRQTTGDNSNHNNSAVSSAEQDTTTTTTTTSNQKKARRANVESTSQNAATSSTSSLLISGGGTPSSSQMQQQNRQGGKDTSQTPQSAHPASTPTISSSSAPTHVNEQVRATNRTQLKLGEELTTLKGHTPFALMAHSQSSASTKNQQANNASQVTQGKGAEEERVSVNATNPHKNNSKSNTGDDSNKQMAGAVQGAIRPQDNNQNSTFNSGKAGSGHGQPTKNTGNHHNSTSNNNHNDHSKDNSNPTASNSSATSKTAEQTSNNLNLFGGENGASNNATGAWKLEESASGVLGMSVNLHLPLNLHKSIHTKKAQMDFIVEQSEHRMRSVTQMLQSERETVKELKEQVQGLVLERAEMADQCKAQYAQAKMHYENFRLLETEVKSTNEIYKDNLAEMGFLVGEIAEKIGKGFSGGVSKADKNECLGLTKKLEQLQKNLLGQVNKIIADSDAFSHESESAVQQAQQNGANANNSTAGGLFEIQNTANFAIQAPLSHINQSLQGDQYDLTGANNPHSSNFTAASLNLASLLDSRQQQQDLANSKRGGIQMDQSNILVDMDAQYDTEASDEQSMAYPEKVYNKLHDEIVLFNLAVKDVMEEIEPIKGVIIGRVQKIMEKSIPNAGIEIYGSHATKLCLQWSDIDIALIPPSKGGHKQSSDVFLNSDSSQGGGRGGYQNQQYGSQRYQTEDWLDRVADELKRDEHRSWLKEIQYITNTTVPVIKLKCVYYTPAQIEKGNLLLPNGKRSKFPSYVVKEINVDITLITDGHNGIRCVDLVKEYLSESQLIQPIILVLKQMLKTWGYNDAYSGGLSSYALLLMIVSFLQERKKEPQVQEENLGEVLLNFLRFYSQLDIQKFAVACRNPGDPLDASRTNFYQNTEYGYSYFQPRFVIDDPLNVTNNVGKSAFKFHEIQKIMSMVYQYAFTGCFCTCHHRNASRRSCLAHNPHQLHRSPILPNEHRLIRNNAITDAAAYQSQQAQQQLQVAQAVATAAQAQSQLLQTTANSPPSLNKSQSAVVLESEQSSGQKTTTTQGGSSATSVSEKNQIGGNPPLMHTQSQPFSMGHAQQATAFIPQGTSVAAADIALKSGAVGSISSPNAGGQTNLPHNANALQGATAAGAGAQAQNEEEPDCACDSVLSRLIYCYKRYSQAFEGLQVSNPMNYASGGGGGGGGYNTPQNFLAMASAHQGGGAGGNGGPSFPYNGGNPSFTRQQLQGQLNFGLLQNLQMGNM